MTEYKQLGEVNGSRFVEQKTKKGKKIIRKKLPNGIWITTNQW